MLAALKDESPSVRAAAAKALGALGDPAAVPALFDLLKDKKESVRASAAAALGKMKSPRAIKALARRPEK